MLTRRRFISWAVLSTLIASALCLQVWLRSEPLHRTVLASISRVYEGHIGLDRVAFRWRGGLTLKGVRLHESESPKSPVLCEIPRVELYGSFWDLLHGKFSPEAITVRKPCFRVLKTPNDEWSLHFPIRHSSEGTQPLLFPIHIVDAQLEFRPSESVTDQAPSRITGIQIEVSGETNPSVVRLEGHLTDPLWSDWKLSGTFDPHSRRFRARFQTLSLRLKPEQSEWLGVTEQALWRKFDPSGEVNVDAEISLEQGSPEGMEYQVLLDPQRLSLKIPSLTERITDVAGRVEVTSKSIRVHGLVGSLGTGEVHAAGFIGRESPPQFSATINVRKLSLLRLGGRMLDGVAEPEDTLSGKLQVQGSTDPESWSGLFDGSVTLAAGRVSEPVPLHLSVKGSLLRLDDLDFPWAGGRVVANAVIPMRDGGLVEGSLSLSGVDLETASHLVGVSSTEIGGTIDGELGFTVPLLAWSDGLQWRWNGPVRLHTARFGKLEFAELHGMLSAVGGALSLREGSAALGEQRLVGDVSLSLRPPYKLVSHFEMEEFDLSPFPADNQSQDAAPLLRGRMKARGELLGDLAPLTLTLNGTASMRQLSAGNVDLGNTGLTYVLSGAGFDFKDIELPVYGGKVSARGRWNWAPRKSNGVRKTVSTVATEGRIDDQLRLEGEFSELVLAEVLPQIAISAPDVLGKVSGNFSVNVPKTGSEGAATVRVAGNMESAQLWVGPTLIEQAKASFQFLEGTFNVPQWSAMLPAGRVTGSARLERSENGPVLTAQVSAEKLKLEKLRSLPDSPHRTASVRGVVSGELALRYDLATGSIRGLGTASASTIVLGSMPPIDHLSTRKLELQDRRVILHDFQSSLWGGLATGTITMDLEPHPANLVEVEINRVERVELGRVLEAWPAAAGRPRGKLSGAGKLYVAGDSPGRGVFGYGEVELDAGTVCGLPVTHAEGRIEAWDGATHEFASGRVQPRRGPARIAGPEQKILINVRDARAARGSIQGNVLVGMSRPIVYDANLRFVGMDLASVAQYVFASPHPIVGSLSGETHFHGTSRGASDLKGELREVRVLNANLWPFPVFAVIARVMNLNLTKSGGFHTVEVSRAILSNGVLDFQQFLLQGDAVRLFGQGTVGLDGQINMEVVGNVEAALTKNVPILGTLQSALNFLQQRLVKIRLSGTLSDPMAVPVPLQDLTEPAEKFLKGIVTGSIFEGADRNGRPMKR